MARRPEQALRRGWTTGACATAAASAACTALLTGHFPDPVTIRLPRGETPAFALAFEGRDEASARAGIVKDAGDDPDVTHNALIIASVRHGAVGSGVTFRAGEGVGTVTLPGLPIPPGEPAINPVPRQMMIAALVEVATRNKAAPDFEVEITIPGGEALAARTWNPRLGIVGGLSILGTTGIVTPYSCSAWIHSIHSGIDVARATGLVHIGAATGSTSEAALGRELGLAGVALIDMGDFAGGLLKYLRRHPVGRLTIAGGFAKMTKLAQGFLDLHSGRSTVDFDWLAARLAELGAPAGILAKTRAANTANEILGFAEADGIGLATCVAESAQQTALRTLDGAPVAVATMIVDRHGRVVGECGLSNA